MKYKKLTIEQVRYLQNLVEYDLELQKQDDEENIEDLEELLKTLSLVETKG